MQRLNKRGKRGGDANGEAMETAYFRGMRQRGAEAAASGDPLWCDLLRTARKEQNSGKPGEEEDTGEPTSQAGKRRQTEAAVRRPGAAAATCGFAMHNKTHVSESK